MSGKYIIYRKTTKMSCEASQIMENLEIFLMDQDHFIPDVFEAYFL
jgi:hypothetical protein